jgi:phytanoyl-CoA hydroxylase
VSDLSERPLVVVTSARKMFAMKRKNLVICHVSYVATTIKRCMSGSISAAELKQYNEQGYILRRKNLNLDSVQKYNQAFLDAVDGKVKLPPTLSMMKDISMGQKRKDIKNQESTVTKIQNFEDLPSLYGFCVEPEILANVKSIIGDDVYSIHTMYINKPSDLGTGSSRHPPHQDQLYFPYAPESRICAAWTALEDITTKNGCLFVYPGSHRMPLQPHGYPNDGVVNVAYHGIHDLPPGLKAVDVEMGPGDTIFFHPLLIHGSGPNLSPNFRKAMSCHYAASDVSLVDVSQTAQKELTEEVEKLFQKHRGFAAAYTDLFRIKSRYICGRKSQAIEHTTAWKIAFFAKLAKGKLTSSG